MRRQETRSKDVEDGIDNYDYNNENDKENFVPDVEVSQGNISYPDEYTQCI